MNSLTYFIENHPKKVRWVQSYNLGQIRSNLGKKKERKCYFYGVFFFIFCMSYTFTVVIIEIPGWKLKAKLAKNIIFKED